MADETVRDGLVVGIDYTIKLPNGEAVDTTAGEEPVEILQGAGEIIQGLEKALYGMRVGEQKHVVVPPAEGFGEEPEEESQLSVPRDELPEEIEWQEGDEVYVQTEDAEGPEPAYVVAVNDDEIVLDMNHPLAGKTLDVDVVVRSLRPATEEELAHGHAHGEDWEEEEAEFGEDGWDGEGEEDEDEDEEV